MVIKFDITENGRKSIECGGIDRANDEKTRVDNVEIDRSGRQGLKN